VNLVYKRKYCTKVQRYAPPDVKKPVRVHFNFLFDHLFAGLPKRNPRGVLKLAGLPKPNPVGVLKLAGLPKPNPVGVLKLAGLPKRTPGGLTRAFRFQTQNGGVVLGRINMAPRIQYINAPVFRNKTRHHFAPIILLENDTRSIPQESPAPRATRRKETYARSF
jgi:hypothetical protein